MFDTGRGLGKVGAFWVRSLGGRAPSHLTNVRRKKGPGGVQSLENASSKPGFESQWELKKRGKENYEAIGKLAGINLELSVHYPSAKKEGGGKKNLQARRVFVDSVGGANGI